MKPGENSIYGKALNPSLKIWLLVRFLSGLLETFTDLSIMGTVFGKVIPFREQFSDWLGWWADFQRLKLELFGDLVFDLWHQLPHEKCFGTVRF